MASPFMYLVQRVKGWWLGFFALSAILSPVAYAGETVSTQDALMYLPAGTQNTASSQKYPVVFSFSPGADAHYMVNMWQDIAETNHWMVYASKEYRNNLNMNALYPVMRQRISQTLAKYPQADASRVIFTGMSGGASFSHAMNLTYPGVASALIVNTGRIWEDVFARHANQKQSFDHSRQLIVFLASPTDFRYQEMKRDFQVMKTKGWKVHWIEFPGGHRYAPQSVYAEAVQWIVSQPEWQ